jgi:WD40 repeat protein
MKLAPGQIAGTIYSVAFAPDSRTIAAACATATIELWDARKGRLLRTLRGHTKMVQAVAFSPDGRFIVSGSNANVAIRGRSLTWSGKNGDTFMKRLDDAPNDYRVLVWDARTGKLLRALNGHKDGINSVAFSPDSTQIASASEDTTVRLWDVASGRTERVLKGHTVWCFRLPFRPTVSGWPAAATITPRACGAFADRPVMVHSGKKMNPTHLLSQPWSRKSVFITLFLALPVLLFLVLRAQFSWRPQIINRYEQPLLNDHLHLMGCGFAKAAARRACAQQPGSRYFLGRGKLLLWRAHSKGPARTLSLPRSVKNSGAIGARAFSPDGKMVVAAFKNPVFRSNGQGHEHMCGTSQQANCNTR